MGDVVFFGGALGQNSEPRPMSPGAVRVLNAHFRPAPIRPGSWPEYLYTEQYLLIRLGLFAFAGVQDEEV